MNHSRKILDIGILDETVIKTILTDSYAQISALIKA